MVDASTIPGSSSTTRVAAGSVSASLMERDTGTRVMVVLSREGMAANTINSVTATKSAALILERG